MDIKTLRRKVSVFAKLLDEPPADKLYLLATSVTDDTLVFEFECSKKLYKSAQDPEVQAMIKEVMDAAYAKFPELANHKVKIEAYRKGENILDDTSMDDDLDMPPSDDAD